MTYHKVFLSNQKKLNNSKEIPHTNLGDSVQGRHNPFPSHQLSSGMRGFLFHLILS